MTKKSRKKHGGDKAINNIGKVPDGKKRRTDDNSTTITTSNSYESLQYMETEKCNNISVDNDPPETHSDENQPDQNKPKKPKPLPAIVVKTDANPKEFIEYIEKKFPEDTQIHFKIGREAISIICYHQDVYDNMKEKLQGVYEFHTFTPRTIKEKKAVIKGLNHKYKVEDVLADLVNQGLPATKVTHMYRKSEEPATNTAMQKPTADMFLVFFNHESNISYLFKGQHSRWVQKTWIKWERYTPKSNNITQCWNCQRLGHSTSNCNYYTRCVKCLLKHERGKCAKKPDDKPACVNCNEDHPANYRKCKAYITYIENISKNKVKNIIKPSAPNFNSENFPSISQRLIRPSAPRNENITNNCSMPSANVTYSGTLKASNTENMSNFNFNEFFDTESNILFGCNKDELYNKLKNSIILYKKTTDISEKRKLLITMIINYGSP